MVLTPQLLQAIKLLQMPSAELSTFIETELERNPLLDRLEERFDGDAPPPSPVSADAVPGDWATETLPAAEELSRELGTETENAFEPDRPTVGADRAALGDGPALSTGQWSGASGGGRGDEDAADIEAYVASQESFGEFLTRQAMVAVVDPGDRLIAAALIDGLDEAGYFRGELGEIALQLGAPLKRVEGVLEVLQTLEPTGVFARDLAECLKLQLIELDRYDPAMQALIANLPKLAQRDWAALRRLCGVDEEDLADMIGEIKRLDPKPRPRLRFGAGAADHSRRDCVRSAKRRLARRTQCGSPAARAGE